MFNNLSAKIILTVLLAVSSTFLLAQNPLPNPYLNPTINYIRTWDATAPESDPNTLMTRPLRDVKQTTQYFDGIGRALQTVVKQGSINSYNISNSPTFVPAVVDMVSAVIYDEYGREQYKYLPFASTATDATKNNGMFKSNPFQQQVAFYNIQLNGQTGETNIGTNSLNWAYSQTRFEPSPLNRVQETYAPGSSWVGSSLQTMESERRSIKAKYYINTAIDAVRIWTVSNGTFPAFGSYSSPPGAVYALENCIKI